MSNFNEEEVPHMLNREERVKHIVNLITIIILFFQSFSPGLIELNGELISILEPSPVPSQEMPCLAPTTSSHQLEQAADDLGQAAFEVGLPSGQRLEKRQRIKVGVINYFPPLFRQTRSLFFSHYFRQVCSASRGRERSQKGNGHYWFGNPKEEPQNRYSTTTWTVTSSSSSWRWPIWACWETIWLPQKNN